MKNKKYSSRESALLAAALYPFVQADYDGQAPIRVISFGVSDIFNSVHPALIQEAINLLQKNKYVELDGRKIGWVQLTFLGLDKLYVEREDFFDDDFLFELKSDIQNLKPISSACL